MKRKPKGWRNESTRHSLARRGIRTSGRKMNGTEKTRYYGAICDPTLKHYDLIEGDHDYKPSTETMGDPFGTVCKWFKTKEERDDFIKYAKEELGLQKYSSSGRPIVLRKKDKRSFDGDLQENEGYTMDELEGTIYDYIKSKHPHATHDNIAMSINNMSMIQRKKVYDDIKEGRDHYCPSHKD